MATASQVVGKVAADIQPLKKGYAEAKEETNNLSSHFKTTLGNLFTTAGGMLAAAGLQLGISTIVSSMKGWIDGAVQAQQNQAALNAVLKSTHDAVGLSAGQINQMVQSLKNLTGVDDDVIMQGTNMLLTFTNIGSSVFPMANQAMLDMAVAMNHGSLAGLDLKDTSIQLGKALNDPINGISALSRVGVTFTDQQKKQIKAMVDAGDTAGAQKLILQELEREFGGAAKAAGDADPFNRWNLAVGDLGKTVGALVLPVLTNLANLVTPLAQWVGDHLPGAFDALKTAMKPVGDFIHDHILPGFGMLAQLFWTDIQPGLKAIGDLVSNLVQPFQNLSGSIDISGVWGPLADAIGSVARGFSTIATILSGQVGQSFDQMKTDWLPIVKQVSDWFQNELMPAIDKVRPSVEGFMQVLITQGIPAFFAVRDAIAHVAAVAASMLLPIWEKIVTVVVPLIGYIYDLGKKALAILLPYVQNAAKEISKFADEMKQRLQPFVENLTKAIQAGADIIGKVWGKLWPWISSVIGIAWDLIKLNLGIIWEGIKGAFRIGADIVTGKWGKLWDDIKGLVSGVWDKIKGVLGDLWANIQGAFQAASGLISGAWQKWIVGPIQDVLNGAIAGMEDLWNQFLRFLGQKPNQENLTNKGGGADTINNPRKNPPPKQHFAAGGITAGGWLTMNEGGGELAFLPGGSLIVPRDLSRQIANAISSGFSGMRGGGDTVNFYGPTSEQLLKEVRLHQQRRASYYGR